MTAAPTTTKPGRRRTSEPRNNVEETLQRATAQWIFLHEKSHPVLRWAYHTPNGGARSKGESGKLKAMGVRRGVVDWVCPFPSRTAAGLAIELKAPGAKATQEQQQFLAMAEAAGWIFGVVSDLDAFIALVKRFVEED